MGTRRRGGEPACPARAVRSRPRGARAARAATRPNSRGAGRAAAIMGDSGWGSRSRQAGHHRDPQRHPRFLFGRRTSVECGRRRRAWRTARGRRRKPPGCRRRVHPSRCRPGIRRRGNRPRHAGRREAREARDRRGFGRYPQGCRRARRSRRRCCRHQRRVRAQLRPRSRASGRRGEGGRDPDAHARHAGDDGQLGEVPGCRRRGRRGARGHCGKGGNRRDCAGGDRARPRFWVRQDRRAQLSLARRTGHDRRRGLSCSRRPVAQALFGRGDGTAGRRSRSRDGRRLCPRLGAGGAAIPSSRRRPDTGSTLTGEGHDELNVDVDAFKFLSPRLWPDLFEILIVTFVIYRFLLFLVGTRALQIVIGLVILSLTYFVAVFAKFTMISTLLGVVFTYGAFAAVVVFQPELRNALARLGQSRLMRAFSRGDPQSVAGEIAEALDRLARARTRALIAVQRDISLVEFITTGVPMEAKVSADLLTTIFTPYSPLHDGAILIRGDQIIGAGCVLPLTQFKVTDKSLGTRHRAALGLSEETDATVLVVSEETSTISIASHGVLHRPLTSQQVRDLLSGAINHLEGGERVTIQQSTAG